MRIADSRAAVLTQLWAEIESLRPENRILVALDGFDGAGKSHLSRELAVHARRRSSRPVVRVSIDGFHRPKAERVAAGAGPEGFYSGSYRYDAFHACVVDGLRVHGSITPGVWDVDRDEAVNPAPIAVPPAGVVLVDGIFLQRPELAKVWDATVWVHAPFEVSVPRGNARFPGNHDPDPEAPSNRRYVGGQRLYLSAARPQERATWVWDNTILEQPTYRRNGGCTDVGADRAGA
ncbi:uridine kinase [Microbacterium maritypicum]|uniref:uridine kinase n=1 Tax=Microbacterium maritypicum TaxID=33918 RepID=UPI00267195DF|nr:uridine kinase [Microbacterium liquefaciens]WKT90879.1 uridine kinase [Microbacterium liquefaciens]